MHIRTSTLISRCILLLAPFVAAVHCPHYSLADSTVVLENDYLAAEFSETDGALVRICHKQRALELIKHVPETRTPWAMLLTPLQLVSDFDKFELTRDEACPHRIVLTWHTPYDITIVAKAILEPDADQIEFTCSAHNSGNATIVGLRYPAIQGIGTLSDDGTDDRLLHSVAMGAVFRNPFQLFQHDTDSFFERGLAVSRYPNGFHGSALQLMSYYVENQGGFYLATHDGHATDKDLNFFKYDKDSLSCEFAHFNWKATPGTSLELDYPVVLAVLSEGTWYEAADRYRSWGTRQPWCARGTRRQRLARGDAARWLMEDIGTVGIWWPFRENIESAVRRTRAAYGAPLLHLELWWQNEPSVQAAHREGDRFGPFYFPYLCLQGSKTFEAHQTDMIFPPGSVISEEWKIMCAAQPEWRRVFIESAVDLVGDSQLRHSQIWIGENQRGCDADCLYYDIGPCAGIPTHCYAAGHDHPPGAGRGMTESHLSLATGETREPFDRSHTLSTGSGRMPCAVGDHGWRTIARQAAWPHEI